MDQPAPPPQEDRKRRRLRQQAETAGSLAPRNMGRALGPSRPPAPRGWSDMGRAEKYALVQSQVLLWVLAACFGRASRSSG